MRTKITIIFETHGLGTVQQLNEWNDKLLEKVADILELKDAVDDKTYPLVTFDVIAVEKLPDDPA